MLAAVGVAGIDRLACAGPGPVPAAGPRAELDRLRRQHALALARAERAERRLRARLLTLAWPATLAGLAGGFAAVVALRLAGL